MYVKAINDVVSVFPYYINTLKVDNPNTSFPDSMTDEMLASWDIYPVTVAEQPTHSNDQMPVMDSAPTLVNGAWLVGWSLRSLTQEELNEMADDIRDQRNTKLDNSDWTQISDSPLSAADKTLWQTYRQALRDITDQTGFPTDVTWPTEP